MIVEVCSLADYVDRGGVEWRAVEVEPPILCFAFDEKDADAALEREMDAIDREMYDLLDEARGRQLEFDL